jgi:hypothetical protein
VNRLAIVIAFAMSACAPAGYMYDVGNLTHPHPTPSLCASRGQVLDSTTLECMTPPPPPLPTTAQLAQAQQSNAITSERNACESAATAKFKRGEQGRLGGYAIWRAGMNQCDDLMLSQLAARKLDWTLRYRAMLYDLDQQAMAEDRYNEMCGTQ